MRTGRSPTLATTVTSNDVVPQRVTEQSSPMVSPKWAGDCHSSSIRFTMKSKPRSSNEPSGANTSRNQVSTASSM